MSNQDTNKVATSELQERPLVTFALFAYNQEKYIREAVEGALAQTYSPLEIILSDDCSTDRTFEIMQEMVKEYDGLHGIILNRNPVNYGIGEHINHVMRLSKGALIVVAAGDDISCPQRTTSLLDIWVAEDRQPDSLCSSVYLIDSHGIKHGESLMKMHNNLTLHDYDVNDGLILGASHGWTRAVFDYFGPLSNKIINEDSAIGFRSLLLGGIKFVDQPLVNYRIDSGITGYGIRKKSKNPIFAKITNARRIKNLIRQHLYDINTFTNKNPGYIFPEAARLRMQNSLNYSNFVLRVFEKMELVGACVDIIKYKLPLRPSLSELAKGICPSCYCFWYKKYKTL